MQPHILFDFAIKVKSWVKKREQIVNNLSVVQEIRWFFIVATIFKWIGCDIFSFLISPHNTALDYPLCVS